jgi:hypothetical protein
VFRRALLAGLLAGTLLAVAANAAIVVQRGIAGVSIGMSQKKVRALLGKPTRAFKSKDAFGIYVEYRYPRLILDFQGGAVLSNISTTRRSERTAKGVGVDSTAAQVQARVRGAHCKVQLCTVGKVQTGRVVTTFYLRKGKVSQVSVGRVLD